jgi:hypothetical protein
MIREVAELGFAIATSVVDAPTRQNLIAELGPIAGAGRRGLLAVPAVSRLACSPTLLSLVRPHVNGEPSPVRSLYFDKSPDTNWLVAWHQDTTIAVSRRADVTGFGPWSVKDEIPHVRPPEALLQQLLTVRIHLDDADETNGALRVIPGSHRYGILSADRVHEIHSSEPSHLCVAAAGDVMLMRPLLLHASHRSKSSTHRRVLHIEYAAFDLPRSLEWNEAA